MPPPWAFSSCTRTAAPPHAPDHLRSGPGTGNRSELRQVVEQQTRGSFTIGDRALEIEPLRPRGGIPDAEWTIRESLLRLAEDIGLTFNTVKQGRWVASRWPEEHRQAGVSFTIHRILARIEDDTERFAAILNPPEGKKR